MGGSRLWGQPIALCAILMHCADAKSRLQFHSQGPVGLHVATVDGVGSTLSGHSPPLVPITGASMAELSNGAKRQARISLEWELHPKRLGAGSFGAVYKARPAGDDGGYRYVVKVATSGTMLKNERNMMRVVRNSGLDCRQHVVDLVEDDSHATATISGTQETFSDIIVMPLMTGDLLRWSKFAELHERVRCKDVIMRQIRSGLDCMHENNMVHLDVKANNVFYQGLEDGCPAGVVIGDLGNTAPVGIELNPMPFKADSLDRMPQYPDIVWDVTHVKRTVTAAGWLDDEPAQLIEFRTLAGKTLPWTRAYRLLA